MEADERFVELAVNRMLKIQADFAAIQDTLVYPLFIPATLGQLSSIPPTDFDFLHR